MAHCPAREQNKRFRLWPLTPGMAQTLQSHRMCSSTCGQARRNAGSRQNSTRPRDTCRSVSMGHQSLESAHTERREMGGLRLFRHQLQRPPPPGQVSTTRRGDELERSPTHREHGSSNLKGSSFFLGVRAPRHHQWGTRQAGFHSRFRSRTREGLRRYSCLDPP